MTSYRLMDGQSGRPGEGSAGTRPPAAATAYSGNYVPGIVFEVTAGNMWLEGYWWWVPPSGGLTAAQKFCLWSLSVTSGSGALSAVVPGTTTTSGTLSPGWNYVPLPAPAQLATGSPYVAATGVNGAFPDTQNQFGAADPYSAGITNGPLFAYPDQVTAAYALPQSPFSTTFSDPTAGCPGSEDLADILWLDVQVTDTAPAGYLGSYRLWPNKYDSSPATTTDNSVTFVLATEVHLSRPCTLNGVWYFSRPGAASLATWCGVYDILSLALVAADASPSWTKPDGVTAATAGGGWARCAFTGVTLPAGQYKVCYYNAGGAGGSWSCTQYGYWNGSGAGSSGVTSGPLYAPPMASAATAYIFKNDNTTTPPYTGFGTEPSQGTFAMTGPQYPYLAVDYTVTGGQDPPGAVAESFWADLEVTLAPVPNVPPYTASMSSM